MKQQNFKQIYIYIYIYIWLENQRIWIIWTKKDWGWQWGGTGTKDGVFVLILHGFVLPHPHPVQHDGENFLTPSLPFGAPPQPVKLHFLLICPTTSTIFLMKPISLMQIHLKLQLNLSHQIKSIFRKNWIIYLSV